MKPLLALCVLTLTVLGCSTNVQPPPRASARIVSTPAYTAEETKWLTHCVALTDTAWSIADRKISGAKREEVEAYYANKPDSKLAPNVKKFVSMAIDRIYTDKFSNPWDYSVAFFAECADNVAHVPAARVKLGSYCMQRAMLSSLAGQFRESGASKAQAYQRMPIQGATSNVLVDKVYARASTRAAAMMDGWNDCLDGAPPI